jgi:D-tyrosyl-tRNA(Tyr) deacylase
MMFTRDTIIGFVAGIAAGVAGYHYYRKNQAQISTFLAGHGINLPAGDSDEPSSELSMEQLVAKKEQLEDLIAEREAAKAQS